MGLELYVIDEVNAKLDGLPDDDLVELIDAMKLPIKGAYCTPAVQLGISDGKEPMFTADGFFHFNEIEYLLSVLADLGYKEDEIHIEDMREPLKHPVDEADIPVITSDYFSEYGIDLWDHQDDFFNKFLRCDKGIFDASTSAGKTLIMAGTAKLYEDHYPSLCVTLNDKLVSDAAKMMEKMGMDYAVINAKVPVKKRAELIKKHRHIITTRKLAMNLAESFEGFVGTFITDECYHPSHELLTPQGWKYIADIGLSDEVMAYDPHTEKMRFELVEKKIEKEFSGELCNLKSNRRFDILVTPNHEHPTWSSDFKKYNRIKMKDFKSGMVVPVSGYIDGNGDRLSDFDKLRIAFEADGHLLYEFKNEEMYTYRFSFRRERKISQMKELLNNLGIDYRLLFNKRGDTSFVFNSRILMDKSLKSWFDPYISFERNIDFLEEICLWDGTQVGNSTNSMAWEVNDEEEGEFVAMVAHLCGRKATVTHNGRLNSHTERTVVRWSDRTKAKQTSTKLQHVPYDGMVYCVSVKSGNLLTRRNGLIGISGNCHVLGDSYYEFGTKVMADCPVRLGLTGSLPDKRQNPLKRQKILNMIGGGIVKEVLPSYLMEKGYAATLDIRVVKIQDDNGLRKQQEAGKAWDWPMEEAHYNNDADRIIAIAEFIDKKCPRNTLIICRPELGKKLAAELDCDYVDGETDSKIREMFYGRFDEDDEYRLVASIGTSGVGLSIDLIYYGVVIDIGANPSVAGQSVGRFMRKDNDGDLKDSAVVWDIYSNMKFGSKQKRDRMRYFKERGFTVHDKYETIHP